MSLAGHLAVIRALHVVAVVLWIGGVAFVTTVLLPAIRRIAEPAERVSLFERIERRFAWQARGTTLLAGVTGFALLHGLSGWDRYRQVGFWWIHAMTLVWALFTLMLFVLEPLVLHRWFRSRAAADPERTFSLIERLHRILLALSVVTLLGAVAGSHGFAGFGG
jgi:uncharacterized membrane protein